MTPEEKTTENIYLNGTLEDVASRIVQAANDEQLAYIGGLIAGTRLARAMYSASTTLPAEPRPGALKRKRVRNRKPPATPANDLAPELTLFSGNEAPI